MRDTLRRRFIYSLMLSLILYSFGFIIMYVHFHQLGLHSGGGISDQTKLLLQALSISWMSCLLVGFVCYLSAHFYLASWKGYSGLLFVLGFFQIFGLLLLFLLPERKK